MGQVPSDLEAASCMSGLRLMGRRAELVEVHVRLLSGESRTLRLPATATGRDIKSSLRRIWHVPEVEQRLSCGAAIVRDEARPLEEEHTTLELTRVSAKGKRASARGGRLGSARLASQRLRDLQRHA
ncbi:unnamed protein product [Effrenium voratum]|nr:unnamed protein product [Effrenium voratum]